VADQSWEIYGVLTPEGQLLFYSDYEGETGGGRIALTANGRFQVGFSGDISVSGSVARQVPYRISALYREGSVQLPIQ